MIRRYLAWRFAGWLLPAAWRLTKALVLAAAALAAAPATLVAAAAVTLAWRRGWPPARLARAAAACAPMLAVWLAATAVAAGTLAALPAAPYRAWLDMWHDAAAGRPLLAAAVIAPLAIPARAGGRRARLVAPDPGDGIRQQRPVPRVRGRVRPAAVAASGRHRAGTDSRPRIRTAD